MLGFVVRRLRGRWPLAVAALLTVLITATALTALTAFTRGVAQEGLRRALTGPERSRTTVVVTSGQPVSARAKDDEAVRAFAGEVFGRLPVSSESMARSRSYGLPGAAAPGQDAHLTVLAALGRDHVRLLAGDWPRAATAPAGAPDQPLQAAVPRTALARLGLAESALPAPVRLDDRFGGPPLTVLVTGVYRATDPDSGYWRLDPLGGREIQVASFTTYGPLMVDDTAFTTGGILQDYRGTLLTPDLRTITGAEARAVRTAAGPAGAALKRTTSLQAATELPELLARLDSGLLVARSTLLVGALQLTVLSAAALLLVAHLMTVRQEPERILLTARGASRRRLGALGAAESLLLALPAAVLAPLLAPPLLRLLGRFGPLGRVHLEVPDTWLVWPVAAGCALACVLLTTLPAVLRGASAAVLRRAGSRQALVTGAARSGLDLAVVALAVLCHQQLSHYGGTEAATPDTGPADGGLGVDPVLVAAPVLALCAGTLLVLRLLPFVARAGGRLAARGRSLGPALAGWQLARRPGRATGPVLLLVLAVSSGVLALGQHSAWSASQRDQADFATAGGLRISDSSMSPMGQGGRYGALPGADRLIPVVRRPQQLPGGGTADLLALDAVKTGAHVPLRADLRGGRPMRELFAPLAASGPDPGGRTAAAAPPGVTLPGSPRRVDLDVTVRSAGTSWAAVSLLLRDRYGVTHTTQRVFLPADGDATLRFPLDSLTDAPIGAAATPLALAAVQLSYAGDDGPAGDGAELTLRRIAASDTADGTAAPAAAPAASADAAGWRLAPPTAPRRSGNPVLSPAAAGSTELLRLRYWGGFGTEKGVNALMFPAPAAPVAPAVPAVATTRYLHAVGASAGDTVHIAVGAVTVPLRITAAVDALPVAGRTALAVDLGTIGRFLLETAGQQPAPPTEWWLPAASATDPVPARVAEALRAGVRTEHVQLGAEMTAGLLDDPLSVGPQSALAALALTCAVLAAIGFATATAAERRVRGREFSVLLALGTPRRSLARAAAAEGGALILLGAAVGTGLGVALVHLMAPLVVLTRDANRPFPPVRVDMPLGQTLLTAAAIAAVPLLSAAFGGPRGRDIAARLRPVEEM
ncbi:FtsX-like permease family protein [Streptomyces racemochromogenes]|uniref:FtsX-like permease family protein n=1 Tax=Streptomyces racemochromogenes TaxID=67353 RepID=A0ABW7PKM8_9ACTN